VACQDADAVVFYKRLVKFVGKIYTGSQTQSGRLEKDPKQVRVRVKLSENLAEPERILKML